MSTKSKEIKYCFCNNHVMYSERYFGQHHPGYKFNTYPLIPPKKCSYTNCSEPAYYESIGIQVPEYMPQNLTATLLPECEIYNNAKEIMLNGPAIDRLVVYLKSKIIQELPNYVSNQLYRHYASLILKKLGIKETDVLTDTTVHYILLELGLYPKDYTSK